MNRKIEIKAFLGMLVGVIGLIAFDQWTKYLAVAYLRGTKGHSLISGILELRYLENNGAAFSMLEGKQIFFRILTIVFVAAAVLFLIRIPKKKKYVPLLMCICILFAGAVGNFIDRIRLSYVVDFIYIRAINFPIFNIADIYVTAGVILLMILVLFFYKDADLKFRK